MKITMQLEYAMRAMIELAREYKKGLITAKDLAERREIPLFFLTKILSTLTKSGLVSSYRGSRGGIALAKEPSKITAYDIMEAVEGPMVLNECLAESGFCMFKPQCKVHLVLQRTQAAVKRELNVTLDKLI